MEGTKEVSGSCLEDILNLLGQYYESIKTEYFMRRIFRVKCLEGVKRLKDGGFRIRFPGRVD